MIFFSVFDRAVGAFMPLFPARTKGEAVRMVSDAVADPSGQFAKHLTDYTLFEVGTWDDRTGKFVQDNSHPERIIELLELKGEGG